MKKRVRRYIKKYLAALAPVAIAALFALSYATVYTRATPESGFAHKYTLIDFISENWFLIGAVISGVVILVLVVDDLIKYLEKRRGHGATGGKGEMGGMAVSK